MLSHPSSPLWRTFLCSALLSAPLVDSIALDITSQTSIKAAAKIVAADLISYYSVAQGQLPYTPYYWWESGSMWGSLINYWHYTGDTTYTNLTITGLQSQVGTYKDYEPSAQTFDLGNDDQAFWAMAVMTAAEYNFPNPSSSQPQWLALAQAVFNRQAARWDTATCNGGLRWQIFLANAGYDYKNSVSNGALFNIASRLARYTGNTTYSDWAVKIWDWELSVGLIQPKNNYAIYDGTTPSINCSQIDHLQWSYTTGMHLHGAAVMWNLTGSDLWYNRTQGMMESTSLFMRENDAKTSAYILYEIECEGQANCDTDQLSFKACLARWMAAAAKMAPWTSTYILTRLQASAQAAATACTGGANGTSCGFRWYTGAYDGNTGAGQQMNALEVIQGLLVDTSSGTVTNSTGGTSTGDAQAGTGSGQSTTASNVLRITSKDRAGAWFLTAGIAVTVLGGGAWMIL